MSEWKEVGTELWTPVADDVLEGRFVKRVESEFGESPVIEKADGSKIRLKSLKVLATKFEDISIGAKVRITCLGMKESKDGKREYMDFKVETQ